MGEDATKIAKKPAKKTRQQKTVPEALGNKLLWTAKTPLNE